VDAKQLEICINDTEIKLAKAIGMVEQSRQWENLKALIAQRTAETVREMEKRWGLR